MRPTKAHKRAERMARAQSAGRKTLYEVRAEARARRPQILGGVRPLIERLHPWDFACLPVGEWRKHVQGDLRAPGSEG